MSKVIARNPHPGFITVMFRLWALSSSTSGVLELCLTVSKVIARNPHPGFIKVVLRLWALSGSTSGVLELCLTVSKVIAIIPHPGFILCYVFGPLVVQLVVFLSSV